MRSGVKPTPDDPNDLKRNDPEWLAGYRFGLSDPTSEPPRDKSPLWLDGYWQGQRES